MAHVGYPDLMDIVTSKAYYTQQYKDIGQPLAQGKPQHYWDTVTDDSDDAGVVTFLRYLGTNADEPPRYYVGLDIVDLTSDDNSNINTKLTFFIVVMVKRVKRELTNLKSYFKDEGVEVLDVNRPWKPPTGAANAAAAVPGASASSASDLVAAPSGAPPLIDTAASVAAAAAAAAAAATATVAAAVHTPLKRQKTCCWCIIS